MSQDEITPSCFNMLRFLFAAVCYNYSHLDANLHESNGVRASPLFIAAGRGGEGFRKLAVVKYPWNKTDFTPFFTGIPPHVLIMVEIEELKIKMEQQKNEIVTGLSAELDRRHIGGDAFQATQILDEVKKAHDSMLEKLNSISLASNTNAANTSRSLPLNVFDVDQEDGDGINDKNVAAEE